MTGERHAERGEHGEGHAHSGPDHIVEGHRTHHFDPARLVGERGRVYAADVQPGLLEMCLRRAAEAGVSGIETVHSEESHVPLPDGTADRVFIAFVLHEADEPVKLLGEAARLLRPGGEVAVVDWHKTEGTPGPPLEHRISEDELADVAAQAGLKVVPSKYRSENYYLVRLGR